MAKKPWRVVEPGEDAGRVKTAQVLAAIEAIKARKEALCKSTRVAKPKRKRAKAQP